MMDKPQIIEHLQQSVNYTIYDTKWMPCSAKFVVLGSRPNGTGIMEIYELNEAKVDKIKEITKKHAFKCGTFGGSSLRDRHLATGDFEGNLQVIDLERPELPVYKQQGHKQIINAIDAIGGTQVDCGPPEIVTGGRDGAVKVWDVRVNTGPVIVMSSELHAKSTAGEPSNDVTSKSRDCWAVAFGNSYSNEDRNVAAGYDNGDLKLFDLRAMNVLWETSLPNGICGLEFDRRDIPMNKLVVTTLEGGLIVYDMRTQHATKGYASVQEHNAGRSVGNNGIISGPKATVWLARHLPQNRDLFMTCGGTGSLRLWQYDYPAKRRKPAGDGLDMGVAGTLQLLGAVTLSTQPVHCYDWHPDKEGLSVCGALDQTVRVLVTTRLKKY